MDTLNLDHWVITDGFEVMTVQDFLNSVTDSPAPHLERISRPHYTHREDAEVAARERCEVEVELARSQLLMLKHILKVERPWEPK